MMHNLLLLYLQDGSSEREAVPMTSVVRLGGLPPSIGTGHLHLEGMTLALCVSDLDTLLTQCLNVG